MKIAFISDAVYPYMKGGKEKRLHEISTKLAKKGHDVHIYCMRWWDGDEVIKEKGVYLHAISPFYTLYTKKGKRSIKEAIMFSLHILPKMIREDFDIIDVDHMPHFPVFPAWLLSKLKRKPLVVTWHEFWGKYWFTYLGWKGAIGYVIEWLAKLCSKNIICVSELTRRRLNKPVNLIYNGINLNSIRKAKPSKQKFDILFVGRLIKEKNVKLIIKTVKDKYKVGIVGEGPDKKRLERLARKYPNIKFLGRVPNVYSYMKSAKLFVFPSTREGFGIVVIEALACGLTTVVLDYPDSASKYLVPEEFVANEKNLLEKIENAFGKKIKLDKKKYSWKNITNQVEKVYKDGKK